MAVLRRTRSIAEMLTDMVHQAATLVRTEGELARAEVSENIGRAALGLGLIIGGAILLIPALVVLLQAGVAALIEHGLAAPWSALIVGGIVLVLGLVLAALGINRLKIENMMPNKTMRQLRQDAYVATDQMREGHDVQRAA